jgi:hypothetical protein
MSWQLEIGHKGADLHRWLIGSTVDGRHRVGNTEKRT